MKKMMMVLLGSAVLLAGCGSVAPTVDGRTHVYTQKQKCPALLDMDRGEVLELSVPENSALGNTWQLQGSLNLFKVEETWLAQAASADNRGEAAEKANPKVASAGGVKSFRFTALQPGQELIHVVQRTPGEKSPSEWKCRVRIS